MSLLLVRSYGVPEANVNSGIGGQGFFEEEIQIGEERINADDFCVLVAYFMTNTDLELNDCRIALKELISNLKTAKGYNGDNVRFATQEDYEAHVNAIGVIRDHRAAYIASLITELSTVRAVAQMQALEIESLKAKIKAVPAQL